MLGLKFALNKYILCNVEQIIQEVREMKRPIHASVCRLKKSIKSLRIYNSWRPGAHFMHQSTGVGGIFVLD